MEEIDRQRGVLQRGEVMDLPFAALEPSDPPSL
jgi:hypothetical protein